MKFGVKPMQKDFDSEKAVGGVWPSCACSYFCTVYTAMMFESFVCVLWLRTVNLDDSII